ncbi:MAG: hypothetical protein COA94_02170 [Rickettsiales bacterium]|nr:MAG: hypothetical protein COA94_02170 [Rickettsiales bacterium]
MENKLDIISVVLRIVVLFKVMESLQKPGVILAGSAVLVTVASTVYFGRAVGVLNSSVRDVEAQMEAFNKELESIKGFTIPKSIIEEGFRNFKNVLSEINSSVELLSEKLDNNMHSISEMQDYMREDGKTIKEFVKLPRQTNRRARFEYRPDNRYMERGGRPEYKRKYKNVGADEYDVENAMERIRKSQGI